MANAHRLRAGVILLALSLLVAPAADPAHAAATFAQLRSVSGDVLVSPGNRGQWIAATPSLGLGNNDAVRTGSNGSALLVHGRSELFLKPSTTTVIGYSSVQIRHGSMWFRMQKSEIGFKFITDVATATIRGTWGLIACNSEMMSVSLLKGRVEITGENDNKSLEARHEAIVRRGRKIQIVPLGGSRLAELLADFVSTAKGVGGGGGGGSSGDGELRGQATPRDSRGFPIPALDPRSGGTGGLGSSVGSLGPSISIAGSAPLLGTQLLIGGSTATIGGAVGTVGGTVGGAIGTVGGTVGGAIGTVGGTVGGAIGTVGGTVGGAIGTVGGTIGGAIGGTTGSTIGGATGTIGGAVGGATGSLGGVIGGATGTVGGTSGTIGGLLGGGTGGLGGGLP